MTSVSIIRQFYASPRTLIILLPLLDSGAIQLDAIKSGVLAGSITQNPVQIGYQAVTLAAKAAKGEPVEDVDTGALWYDSANMDSAEVAPCLYK